MTTLRSYIIGFTFSLILTLAAFMLVAYSPVIQTGTATLLVLLALAQLAVQLKFFLHVNKDSNPWNTGALIFALLIVFLVVGGSLWIMKNLNHAAPTSPFVEHISPQGEH